MKRYDRPPLRGITPNLAPLVDVVMVILIFFMLGTSFASSEGLLPTQLPTEGGAGGGPPSISPVVRIALSPGKGPDQCRIEVAGWTLPAETFEGLHEFLKGKIAQGADAHGRIVIAARPAVRYEYVISALDACVRAGFKNVQFAISGAAGTGGVTTTRP